MEVLLPFLASKGHGYCGDKQVGIICEKIQHCLLFGIVRASLAFFHLRTC